MISLGTAHLLSGDAFGATADLPWSIYLWGEYRHPSQVYEILAALIIYFVTHRQPLGQPGSGADFLMVVTLSSGARLFLEAFRGDSFIWPGGFRAAQVIALGLLAFSLCWMRQWAWLDRQTRLIGGDVDFDGNMPQVGKRG